MEGMEEYDWPRLGRCVRARRDALGLTQADVYAAGGPSPATLYLLETGQRDSYRPKLLRGLERALGWEPRSVVEVLRGGEPVEEAEPAATVATPSVSTWLTGFRQLPLTPREKVGVLVRLLDEAAAELDEEAVRGG